jgi:hypothetical protein
MSGITTITSSLPVTTTANTPVDRRDLHLLLSESGWGVTSAAPITEESWPGALIRCPARRVGACERRI